MRPTALDAIVSSRALQIQIAKERARDLRRIATCSRRLALSTAVRILQRDSLLYEANPTMLNTELRDQCAGSHSAGFTRSVNSAALCLDSFRENEPCQRVQDATIDPSSAAALHHDCPANLCTLALLAVSLTCSRDDTFCSALYMRRSVHIGQPLALVTQVATPSLSACRCAADACALKFCSN